MFTNEFLGSSIQTGEVGTSEVGQLLAGKRLRILKNQVILKKGAFNGTVVRGFWKETEKSQAKEVAVKRIKKIDCHLNWKTVINNKKLINHYNVLKVLDSDEDQSWRYFAVELFDATLEQFCNGQYKGPMPSDAQVLYQIANGIDFLHKRGLSHGQLNPNTILIAQPLRMKVSDFRLSRCIRSQTKDRISTSIENKVGGNRHPVPQSRRGNMQDYDYLRLMKLKSIDDKDGISHPTCWMLSGSWSSSKDTDGKEIITPKPATVNGDVVAAGCIFFYFLTRGSHPFGSSKTNILINLAKMNPVNLKELDETHFAFQPIKILIRSPPRDGTQRLRKVAVQFGGVLPLKIDENKEYGRGGFGTVYGGTYEGNQVAVKKIAVALMNPEIAEQKREVEEHIGLDHENVIKLLYVDEEKDVKYRYLVLELCAGTLTDYCENKYNGPMPPDDVVLCQIAKGLDYIHSKDLVHRDVKPDNILISIGTPIQMKLSDFGFVKKISPQGTFSQSGLKGTEKWMAPEMLELLNDDTISDLTLTSNELPHGTVQSDTFASGCVFFYFLTRGFHPFGNSVFVSANVVQNKPVELIRHKQNLQINDALLFIYDLIEKMIENKPKERIAMSNVIKQLAELPKKSTGYFKEVERSLSGFGHCQSLFHPTEPVFACGIHDKMILLSASNSSIPFSKWKECEQKIKGGNIKKIDTIEWNVDGTQLAAISENGDVIAWNYQSGNILFQQNLSERVARIEWNPFNPNLFATFQWIYEKKVFFLNSSPFDKKTFLFYKIEREERIGSVKWISENKVALGLKDGGIEIWQIDESMSTAKIIKRLEHDVWIHDMVWNERTKYLAGCSGQGWMKIWSIDRNQNTPIHSLKVNDGICLSVAWRPKEKKTDGEELDAARKSPDNFILAYGLWDGRILIWTPLEENNKTRILNQHTSWVHSLSFSPDGRFLASADSCGTVIIWSSETLESAFMGEKRGLAYSLSWISTSTHAPAEYKLTFNSRDGKVRVIEHTVDQRETSNEDFGINPDVATVEHTVDQRETSNEDFGIHPDVATVEPVLIKPLILRKKKRFCQFI